MFASNLLHLLHLSDSTLPIGSFSHSAGLETYVQAGIVYNKETALTFIKQQLTYNICYTDAAFMSLAYDAASSGNWENITQLDDDCTAIKLPREMRQASNKLGTRLLKVFTRYPHLVFVNKYWQCMKTQKSQGHYCIAFGIIANELEVNKHEALTGFFYNMATGFVTNSVKLIPLGQQDGQEMLISLFLLIEELVKKTLSPNKEMIGHCCPAFDLRSMQHEQLYTRLYMS